MPTDKPEDHEDTSSNQPASDSQKPTVHGSTPHSSQEHTRSNKATPQEKNTDKPQVVNIGKIPKIDVIEGVEANAIAERANTIANNANTISRWSVGVSLSLFFCTLVLAGISLWQGYLTRKSVAIADSVFRADTLYNFKTLANQKTASDSTDSNNKRSEVRQKSEFTLQQKTFATNDSDMKERFKRDTEAINLQIKGLKQSQDQFVKQNEPYLKIEIDSVYIKYKQLCFHYTITDLSNTPVRIIGEKMSAQVSDFTPIVNNKFLNPFDGVIYVIKESPVGKDLTLHNLTDNQIKWANNGSYSIFWIAVFEYENQITGEKRQYSINVKINKIRGVNPPYQSFSDNSNKSE